MNDGISVGHILSVLQRGGSDGAHHLINLLLNPFLDVRVLHH
uniref:Uncharacterized protein n=1 Tax=Anguilla anguilla TaxID=7936 RepID=A0A0E9XE20_ANGAN